MSGASWVKVIDNDHIEYDSLEEALQHAADPRHLTVIYSDGRTEEVYQRSFDQTLRARDDLATAVAEGLGRTGNPL